MIPATMSASSGLAFQGCEARFHAENVLRGGTPSGVPADKGTVCHAVCERWVAEGHYLAGARFSKMEAILVEEYYKLFSDAEEYDACRTMLENWYNRQNWDDITVVSVEEKRRFQVPVPGLVWGDHPHKVDEAQDGFMPFTYIRDRLDMRSDGLPQVIDYKTVAKPITPDDLRKKLQARIYGLATQIEYPEAEGVWVKFDLLRYDVVGTFFSKQDNAETWVYLKQLAARVFESDGTKETLNPECRYCVRAGVCQTLLSHKSVGGVLGVVDLAEAVDRLARLKWAMNGLKSEAEELEQYVLEAMEEDDLTEYAGEEAVVKIKQRKTTKIDMTQLSQLVGPEVMGRYKKDPGVTEVNKMLKDPLIDDATKSRIKQLMRKVPGNSWLEADAKSDFEEEA